MIALLVASALSCTDAALRVRAGQAVEVSADRSAFVSIDGASPEAPLQVRAGDAECSFAGNVLQMKLTSRQASLSIPAGVRLSVRVQGGQITIADFVGNAVLDAGLGSIEGTRIAGDVSARAISGTISLAHVKGDVEVIDQTNLTRLDDITGNVRVTSVSGRVQLSGVRGSTVDVSTVSGDVTCAIGGDTRGSQSLRTHTGAISVRLPAGLDFTAIVDAVPEAVRIETKGVAARAGPEKGTLSLQRGAAPQSLHLVLASFSGGVVLRDVPAP